MLPARPRRVRRPETGPGRPEPGPTRAGRPGARAVGRSAGEPRANVARLDRRALRGGEVQEIELRHGVLRDPERLPRSEHEPLDSDGAEQRLEGVLGRPPDPADGPPNTGGVPAGGAEMHPPDQPAVR